VPEPCGEKISNEPLPAPDPYYWFRFPKDLVEAGFATDYLTAAAADIELAAVFLFLKVDVKTFVRNFLLG
jgi:hypothetical protein